MTPAEESGAGVGSKAVDPTLPPVAISVVADAVGGVVIGGDPGRAVTEIAYDARAPLAGALFCCVPGRTVDGHGFAGAAVEGGAAALLADRALDLPVPQVIVSSVRAAMGPAAAAVFGRPADDLTVVAVTGTNGKTTITYLLEAVFRSAGLVPGVIGTTGARIAGASVPLERTTPEAPDLHRLLYRMRAAGVRAVAMEASSHALEQHRVDGVRFDVAVFTNLSQDHLDYHEDMDAYFAAKARLFTPELSGRGAVNAGDPWGRRLLEAPRIPLVSFGVGVPADLRAGDVRADASGIELRVDGVAVRSRLRGAFNAENVVAALAAARLLGIGLHEAAAAIEEVAGVPGRMEAIEAGQDFLVVVDYAHTPDSIRNVLRGARPLATGRVIVVFGCGGDRDRAKRPLMGAAATGLADLTIITSDNPRSEDPGAIVDAIVPGARAGGGAFTVELGRREAIRLAMREARQGDAVVIAGRGHESIQEIGEDALPFDDRQVVREELAELLRGERE